MQRDLGVALSATSRMRPALRRVLSCALSVAGIDAGGVYLVKRSTRTVELVAHRGLSRPFVRAVSRYDVAAPLARAVMRGRPVYRNYRQVQAHPLFVQEGFRSLAGFPIRYSRDVIAVLNVASRSCRTLPRLTRALLGTIAAQIGSVVPRIRAETEWREAQRNLQSLLDTAGDLLFVLDEHGCILEINQAVHALLGYSRRQLLGQSILNMHPRRMRAEAGARMAELLAGQETVYRMPLLTRTGNEIPVETRVTAGRWDGKAVLFGISRDIRERKQLEREVVRISEAETVRLAQDIHDNQMQQLSGIALLAEALKRQLAGGGAAARETADRILAVCTELLAASRRTLQGLAPFAPIEGGLGPALRCLARHVRDTFACDCRIHCVIEPTALHPAVSAQLYYIVQESIRNACSHGGATRIDVRLRVRGAAGTLDITDNGSGMGRDPRPQTGMGLRIMAYRADMIGGDLSVSPRNPRGTRVRCVFSPIPPHLDKQPTRRPTRSGPARPRPAGAGATRGRPRSRGRTRGGQSAVPRSRGATGATKTAGRT